ncbi:ABC transporter ATP-binding protein [Pusillimonas sp. NJUB218]|uniref:ABC transporter ATP-binding protein n=1 Tax=Pusillimonas sp. NJUB218 TaxID=2023230 RepID=UPI0018F49DB4|nr:ABC transporter ATP-binding protein [Pusillimonas sp. NJUB218]
MATNTAPLLDIRDLRVSYGEAEALAGVSFHINRGEIVSIVGANGAGKTTLIRAIAGMIPATSGQVDFEGRPILGLDSTQVCELGIAQVPEGRQIFPSLSVEENLRLGATLRRSRAGRQNNIDRVYNTFPRLAERKTQKAGTLSGGEQQMLAIGRALMANPMLVMFDEPSLGLSPLLTEEMFDVVRSLHANGLSVLLVEQNVVESLELCDRAYVLETGAMVLEGAGEALLQDDRVRQAYLGL